MSHSGNISLNNGKFQFAKLVYLLSSKHRGKIKDFQRSKHGSNCARSSEQQDMLALEEFFGT